MQDTQETFTSIGEIAKKLDMSQRTIRYYEEIGLLNSIKRVEGDAGFIPKPISAV